MKSIAIISDIESQQLSKAVVIEVKGKEVDLNVHKSLDPSKALSGPLSKIKSKLNNFERLMNVTAVKVLRKDGYNKFDQFFLSSINILPNRIILKYSTIHKAMYNDDLIPCLVLDKTGNRVMEKVVIYDKDGSIMIKESDNLEKVLALGIFKHHV